MNNTGTTASTGQRTRFQLLGILGGLLLSALSACLGYDGSGLHGTGDRGKNALPTGESRLATMAFRNAAWDKRDLTVCWEFTTSSTADYRRKMKEVILGAFKESMFTFSGWDACSATSQPDVRMFIYDDPEARSTAEYTDILRSVAHLDIDLDLDAGRHSDGQLLGMGHPRVLFPGIRTRGIRSGLILNQTFENSQPGFAEKMQALSPQGQENLRLSVGLHEFGHVLGFAHEDTHPARTCDTYGVTNHPYEVVTGYNLESFMSRCHYYHFDYEKGILYPNAADIEGLHALHAHLQ